MKCYLHIGLEKTGTTFIQRLIDINRKPLEEAGIYIPESLGSGNHRKISLLGFDPKRRDDYTKYLSIISDDDLKEFNDKTLQNLSEELGLPEAIDKRVLVSSEHIHSRLGTIGEIERLRNSLLSLGLSPFKIIVYLRKPSELAQSIYSTHLKSGGVPRKTINPTDEYYFHLCSHKQTINWWSSIFGLDSVRVSLYNKKHFHNNPLHADFLEAIEVSNQSIYKIPSISNERLSPLAQLLLLEINSAGIDISDRDKFNNIVSRRLEGCDTTEWENPISINEFDSFFNEDCEWVRSRFFPGQESLF
jgi:hypothetical protein